MKTMRRLMAIVMIVCMCVCTAFISNGVTTASAKKVTPVTEVPSGYTPIYTVEDLYEINTKMDGKYILMNDLDLSADTATAGDWSYDGRGWEPIGSNGVYGGAPFTGVFDGNGYSIVGLNINVNSVPSGVEDTSYIGLFSCIGSAGCVKNLEMKQGTIKCSVKLSDKLINVGTLAGQNDGNIENCTTSGSITTSCTFAYVKDVKHYTYVGGTVGNNKGKIVLTKNECTINAKGIGADIHTYAGGLCGNNESSGKIEKCVNIGDVFAEENNNESSGYQVSGGKYYKDNFYYYTAYTYAGGLVGCHTGVIANSYNVCSLVKVQSAERKKNYNTNTSGTDAFTYYYYYTYSEELYAGGIVGKASATTSSIENSYNISSITSFIGSESNDTKSVYAIGTSKGTIANCYYLSGNGMGQTGAKSLSIAQAKIKSSYVGFDFDDMWAIDIYTGYEYPQLLDNYYQTGTDTDKEIVSAELSVEPTTTRYLINDSISAQGGKIKVAYTDGTDEEVTVTNKMLSGYDMSKGGLQTVNITYRGYRLSYKIFVRIPVESVTIASAQKNITLDVGKRSTALSVTVAPSNTTDDKGVTYTATGEVDGTPIVEVSSTGVITAKKAGTAIVTATSKGDESVKDTCTVVVLQPMTELDIAEDSVSINRGETKVLTATYGPEDTTDTITWSSEDPEIASVDSKTGIVTAKKLGRVKIIAESSRGEVSDQCYVTVIALAQTITASKTAVSLAEGESETWSVSMTPSDVTETPVYESADENIATVTSAGVITAKKAGKTTITASVAKGKKTQIEVTVVPLVPIEDVTCGTDNIIKLERGTRVDLALDIVPATYNEKYTLSIENPEIATLVGETIIAESLGSTKLFITTASGVKKYVTIRVLEDIVGIGIDSRTVTYLDFNETSKIIYVCDYAELSAAQARERIGFSTSDEFVATVDEDGVVTGVGEGTARINVFNKMNKDVCSYFDVKVVDKQVKIGTYGIENNKVFIGEGSVMFGATVTPEDYMHLYCSSGVTWSSSNEELPINDWGELSLNTAGKTTITAQLPSGKKDTFEIEVVNDITNATIELEDTRFYYTGGECKPAVTVSCKNGRKMLVEGTDYTCTYSDNVEIGTAKVVVEGIGLYSGRQELTFDIVEKTITSLTLNKTNATTNVGCKVRLSASYLPLDAQNTKNLAWTSSDESIATVDENGLVTAHKSGSVKITLSTSTDVSASCNITVEDALSSTYDAQYMYEDVDEFVNYITTQGTKSENGYYITYYENNNTATIEYNPTTKKIYFEDKIYNSSSYSYSYVSFYYDTLELRNASQIDFNWSYFDVDVTTTNFDSTTYYSGKSLSMAGDYGYSNSTDINKFIKNTFSFWNIAIMKKSQEDEIKNNLSWPNFGFAEYGTPLCMHTNGLSEEIIPATLIQDGSFSTICERCKMSGDENYTIYRPVGVVSANEKYKYTGDAIEPDIAVYNSEGEPIDSKYYDVKYSDNVNLGIAHATITLKDRYEGELKKNFRIIEDDHKYKDGFCEICGKTLSFELEGVIYTLVTEEITDEETGESKVVAKTVKDEETGELAYELAVKAASDDLSDLEFYDGTLTLFGELDAEDITMDNDSISAESNITSFVVTTVEKDGFKDVKGIESIELSDTITLIGASAFENSSIKNMTIPESVKKIEDRAFAGCSEFESITFEGEEPPEIGDAVFNQTPSSMVANVPDGAKGYATILGESINVKEMHEHTFSPEWTSDETGHWHAATCKHTDEISDKEEHSFKEIIDKEETVEEEGSKHEECTVCGYKKDPVTIPKHKHTYGDTWKGDENGHWHSAICSHKDAKSPVEEHMYKEVVDKDPTVQQEGSKHNECTVCGYKSPSVSIAKLKAHVHTYSTDWECDATMHWHAATCEHKSMMSASSAHSFVEVIERQPTASATGLKYQECSVCGYKKNSTLIPATGLQEQIITTAKMKTYKAKNLKKKKITFSLKAKTTGDGVLTYKVSKYTKKKLKKYISVSKTGKVTLKKKAPAGTYKVTVLVSETDRYEGTFKTVTIKVKK